jgi:glycosyltransferase involved in cell wall biosynthesis
MTFDCLVAGSQLRFDGIWQRPHHLLSRLAGSVPVLYVEEPFLAREDADPITTSGRVDVLRPMRRGVGTYGLPQIDDATVAAVRSWTNGRRPLVWLSTPMMDSLAAAFPDSDVVFDRMDDLASFARAPGGLREREEALFERARAIFAGGRSLFERCRAHGGKARLYPSGVDVAFFAQTPHVRQHPLFDRLERPVCGYVGAIDERIDFDVLRVLAEREVDVVLVGPVLKLESVSLPRLANVHFTGQLPYEALPSMLAGFDVALLPFARNEATANISPTKTPEYLAAEKPVVSTAIPDVVATYAGIVDVAYDSHEFAEMCVASIVPDPARVRRGVAAAREMDWDAIVARMWRDLEGE